MAKIFRKTLTGIAICMLLLFAVLGIAFTQKTVKAEENGPFTLEKTVFNEGEAINVTATGSGTDWVGIFREGENASVIWYYVAGKPSTFNVLDGTLNAGESKESITAGTYVIAFIPNDMSGLENATQTQTITIVPCDLKVNKTRFVVGEAINVTATGSGLDWVGIYREGEVYSTRWYYVANAGSDTVIDITNYGQNNEGLGISSTISAGNYTIYLIRNDGAYTDAEVAISITVVPEVYLSTEKTEFALREPIFVTATHPSEGAWVGLYRTTESEYCRWYYISSADNLPFDITKGEINVETSYSPNVMCGDYVLRLMISGAQGYEEVASIEISVVGDTVVPSAPLSASYDLENDNDGFATGTVSVTMPTNDMENRCIVLYWGDDDGILEDYTYIKFKVTGETTSFTFGKHVTIPYGATKLYVYAKNTNGDALSNDCIILDLPKNASHKNPLNTDTGSSFWIISDTHIDQDDTHVHNQHFRNLLGDIARIDGDALSLIVNGDMANRGREGDFANFEAIYESATGVPPMVLAIGNHEFYNASYDSIVEKFYSLAKYPDGSLVNKMHFDYWQDGYHFIFLGTDTVPEMFTHAVLSEETLQWFDKTLDENKDTDKPTFVFIHQPMYDTVAGSRPGEDYNGIEANTEARLRAILADHPEVMLFNGHTHWTMDSEANICEGTTDLPGTIFNTSSAGYLWTTYDNASGDYLYGSEGYYVRVYGGTLYVLGYDFVADKWIASAQYCIKLSNCTTCADNDKDHTCDVCGASVGVHESAQNSHNCGYCSEKLSECVNEDNNHDCDVCGKTLTICEDNDKNGACDICGAETGQPETPEDPNEPNEPVNPEGPNKPNEPVNPEEPNEPNEPVNPEEPNEPNEPVNPEEPNEPNEPDVPEPEPPNKIEEKGGCRGSVGGVMVIPFALAICMIKKAKKKE